MGDFPAVYTKTAKPIEILFDGLTSVDPRNHVVYGGQGGTNPFTAIRVNKLVILAHG